MENRHNCKNRGWAIRMEKDVVRTFIPGTQEDVIAQDGVIRWTCPACGWTGIQVDNHGAPVTAAQMAQLLAL